LNGTTEHTNPHSVEARLEQIVKEQTVTRATQEETADSVLRLDAKVERLHAKTDQLLKAFERLLGGKDAMAEPQMTQLSA